MKSKFIWLSVWLFLACVASQASAEIKKDLGDWEVHYIAFTTTFLTPEIARANNIVRSSKNALVNISVLNKRTKEAQDVNISGTARNLLGTSKTLSFKKVKEGSAIYYLASVPFSDKEVLRFSIDINQGRSNQNLKFQQTMYAE
ncbi:MAG: hypothetical protein ACJA0G_001378 [Kangiellaceae bacterium]|jgi:hypothetical protein